MLKKKLTKKEIQQKYEDLKIDSHRRMAELSQRVREAELGVAQVNATVDMLIGWIAETYGKQGDEGYTLYVPKSNKRYSIEARIWDKDGEVIGYTYMAKEVTKEEENDKDAL